MKNAIVIKGLTKKYRLYNRNTLDRFQDTFLKSKKKRYRDFTAVDSLDLIIYPGEIVGILGRNGAGKSTLLKVICGISPPTMGRVDVEGRIVPLLELGGGFNPEYTGRENIHFYCSLQGMSKKEIAEAAPKIIEFSELDAFIDVPMKKYSSGMKARLGFAVSINIDPDILVLDEVLSVGDELFRRKCFSHIERLFNEGKTVLYVSHNLQTVVEICNRAILLRDGRLIYDGEPAEAVKLYRKTLHLPTQSTSIAPDEKSNQRFDFLETPSGIHSDSSKELEKAFFDPEFVTKSRRTENRVNMEFQDVKITDNQGNTVNYLSKSSSYTISFAVVFNEEVAKIRVGCFILSSKSTRISGRFDQPRFNPIERVESGHVYEYRTVFSCRLVPALYSVMIVVHGTAQGDTQSGPIGTCHDAFLFRVIEDGDTRHVGMVSLFD